MTGWKTYTVAALGVAHAGIGWYLGLHGPDTAMELGLAALGLGSLRHAVASETRRVAAVASPEATPPGDVR